MRSISSRGSTSWWRRQRRLVLERDRYRCQVEVAPGVPCSLPARVAGHIRDRHTWPLGDPGRDDLSNLRAECDYHSTSAGARLGNKRRVTDPLNPLNADPRW